jgi:hypothetical protein
LVLYKFENPSVAAINSPLRKFLFNQKFFRDLILRLKSKIQMVQQLCIQFYHSNYESEHSYLVVVKKKLSLFAVLGFFSSDFLATEATLFPRKWILPPPERKS